MQKTGSDHHHTRQSPDDVRFTKTTIDLNFPGQHEFENIYDVLRALEQKILQPRSLPSLRIFLHDNQLWTIDNKLLYVYRISPKVRRVSVTFISGIKLIDRFLNDNSKSDLDRMASPDFFPDVVRTLSDAQQLLPMAHSSSQECVMLPTVAGFKKMEQDRISNLKAHSLNSPKSSSSRSNSSSKTVASRISSDDNVESDMTAGTETESPYMKPLRTCTVKSKISMESSNNSSVKSYPVNHNARSNCKNNTNYRKHQKKERDPSPDSSAAGQIYSDDFVETSSVRQFSPDELESNVLDLHATIASGRDEQQQPPPSSSCPTRPVVECRDIPVSCTLLPVHTMTEPVNGGSTAGRVMATCAAGGAAEHPGGSEPNTPINFRPHIDCRAESPFRPCSNSTEELSKWRDIDTAFEVAAPDLLAGFSSKPTMIVMMNQAHSESKLTGAEAEDRSRRSSPSKNPPAAAAAEISYNASDSSKDRPLRLDRPLSSCGSSAAPVVERPSTCNFPLDGRRSGSVFRLCSSSTMQPDRNGGNQSPTKARARAFLSAEKKIHGKLSREHELEVSKKILLKHMRKAFFSVY